MISLTLCPAPSPLNLPRQEKSTSPLPADPLHSYPPLSTLHFPSPISLSRQEISPSSPAQSSRSNIQEAGTQRDSAAILAKASLGVRGASPGPLGRGGGRQAPGPGAGSEVHAPGGLTDARGRQSREGGDRNRCREGNGFFVSLLLLDFFLSLDCKKLLWRPAHPGGGCTHTQRSPGCQGPAALLCSGESPGWPGHRLLVASSDEIFFLFVFLSFFFFSISLKYLQQ